MYCSSQETGADKIFTRANMRRNKIIDIIRHIFIISVGSILCAVSINGILTPNKLLTGGISGLCLLIHYFFTILPVGLLYFLFNIPLFLFGWIFVGKRFFFYSLAGMAIFSISLFIPVPAFPVKDPLLIVLTAGIIAGTGSGIILLSSGSGGGTDILAVILLKKYSIRLGSTYFVFSALLMLVSLLFFIPEIVLYTLIFLYVKSQVTNLVVIGLKQRKSIMVISSKWKEIEKEILEKVNRGVTILNGEGGFSNETQRVLFSVITFQELSKLKEIVHHFDPNAFVVVSETSEVMGKNIGNQPHW